MDENSLIKIYDKSYRNKISQHFAAHEFKCHCTNNHEILISDELLSKLDELFIILNCSKIIIYSGHRCQEYDKKVGGNGFSSHTLGKAADINCYDQKGQIIDNKTVFQTAEKLNLRSIENKTPSNPTTHVEILTENVDLFCTQNGVITSHQHDSILNGSYHRGIDVSVHNGEIDWQKVKLDGIEFAIIRISYGSDCEEQDDRKATINISECERLEIPYGVYHYSYSLSIQDIESEVAHVLRMLGGKKPPLGVWFDMEDGDNYKRRKNQALNVENGKIYSEFCSLFCKRLKEEGIDYCGVYTSLNVLENILDLSGLNLWVACWNSYCLYADEFDFWQYSSKGKVNGIDGYVDMDYCLKKFDVLESKNNCDDKNGDDDDL